MLLLYLGSAWLLGIYLGSLLQPPGEVIWLAAMPLAAVAILWRRERPIRIAAVCGLVLLAGLLRFRITVPHFDERALAHYNDTGWTTIRGVIRAEPDVRDQRVNLRLAASQVQIADEWRDVSGTVLVQAPRYPLYRYGDELEVSGLLETPPVFEDFSYRDYLARQGVYSLLRRPQITLLARGRGNPVFATLYAFKAYAQQRIARLLPEPHAALLTGILLGVESGIPRDLYDDFNATGTSHIIVISGFNITIIAGLLVSVARRTVGRRWAVWVTLVGIGLYTVLVGADAAVVRAAIMGGLAVIALHLGRQATALVSLVASALVMTAINPHTLWDVGFQLSFMATLGLISLAPPLQARAESLLNRLLPAGGLQPAMSFLNDALLLTLAAQITTLPLVVYYFGRLSLVSLLANSLILWVQPYIMMGGGLATFVGLFALEVGRVLAWLPWLGLAWTVRVVETMAGVPYAVIEVGRLSAAVPCLYYGLLFGGMMIVRQEPARRRALRQRLTSRRPVTALIAALAVVVVLVWTAALNLPDGRLHVFFLDVGQGDATFIRTPRGQEVLIDGGPSPTALTAALGRRMAFWDRTIDLVVLSHPHDDHVAGLVPVLERYRVKAVLDAGSLHVTPPYSRCLELVQQEHIPYHLARAGMRLRLGEDVRMEILHPGNPFLSGTRSDVNNNSVVLRLSMGRVTFLFPGDLEEEGEAALLRAGGDPSCTVLKVSHHGSDTSLNPRFLEAADPRLAIISVGADNKFGHPTSETLAALAAREVTVFRTDRNGTVEVTTDGQRYWVKTEK